MPGFVAPAVNPTKVTKRRKALPAVWMRAGTSKGLYLHRQDLPQSQDEWTPIITGIMGSYDCDPKQLNGIGGATSTTSKVAVVARSQRPGVDVDYTFVQVPIGSPKLDLTGNCGNIASGVGPFAVDEGIVKAKPGQQEVQVRVFNTNTNSLLIENVQVDEEGHFLEDGDCILPGLRSMGSRVKMAFSKPSGAMTGKLLPTGRPTDIIFGQTAAEPTPIPVQVSIVDAANPFVFVNELSLPNCFREQGPGAAESIEFIESVRRQAAVLMGLASSVEKAALTRGTPKIAILKEPESQDGAPSPDVEVVAYSMGKVHGSLQLTGAVCLGTAACTEGTLAHSIRNRSRISEKVQLGLGTNGPLDLEQIKLRHPGGDMDVDVRLGTDGEAEEVTVFRTARRLFEGTVYYLG